MSRLPEAERPKAIATAAAQLEAALGRLGEVKQQLLEAYGRQTDAQRQANSALVGQGGVTQKQWEEAQEVWHKAQSDVALVEQVKAASEEDVSQARQALAATVVKQSARWQRALERRWLQLDVEARERLEALRDTEAKRAGVAGAHGWLLSALTGDVAAQLEGPYRERGGWRSRLVKRSGEIYFEHELLGGLEELLDETALQRRLDAAAAEARAEEERVADLREEHERQLADARMVQEARLSTVQALRVEQAEKKPD